MYSPFNSFHKHCTVYSPFSSFLKHCTVYSPFNSFHKHCTVYGPFNSFSSALSQCTVLLIVFHKHCHSVQSLQQFSLALDSVQAFNSFYQHCTLYSPFSSLSLALYKLYLPQTLIKFSDKLTAINLWVKSF